MTTANINPANPAGISNDFAINETFRSIDQEIYGKLDGSLEVGDGRSGRSISAPASPITSARSIGWDRGCTLGANGACFGAGLDPFANVNPTPYPAGFNANTLGIPGLLIPLAAIRRPSPT